MTIKERKRMLHFLEMLEQQLENRKVTEINPVFLSLFSRKELIEIVLWLFNNYNRSMLTEKTDAELLELIGDDAYILSFLIEKWNENTIKTPSCSDEEVNELFSSFGIGAHYLRHKPSKDWDEYDKSNYYSILSKHGKVKLIYGVFSSDILEEHRCIVKTKPLLLFDTKEEANSEIQELYKKRLMPQGSLKTISLCQLINI